MSRINIREVGDKLHISLDGILAISRDIVEQKQEFDLKGIDIATEILAALRDEECPIKIGECFQELETTMRDYFQRVASVSK